MDVMKKRITMKLKHPNPLFEQWITEWRDKAIETNSKMQYCFGKALASLRKYPVPLESGRDCGILQGFGDKLCQMLDRKLAEHRQQINVASGEKPSPNKNTTSQNFNGSRRLREYIPAVRSGAYAILITLYENTLKPQNPEYMLKVDIIKNGKHLCDKSFVRPEPGSYYTAWSSMKTLLDKDLVKKRKSPAQFSLTNEGLLLARKLYDNNSGASTGVLNNLTTGSEDDTDKIDSMPPNPMLKLKTKTIEKNLVTDILSIIPTELIRNESSSQVETESTCSSNTSQEETFIFVPHSFEIVLLIDKQEKVGSFQNPLDDPILQELTNLNVLYEARHLKVGDYTWICRQHVTNKELVLPYIIERKRVDDLGASIKDGRFHEQKFRLKQCGIPNLIYLIESYGNNTYTGLPMATLYQAATNTLVQDNFSVKFTNSLRGTAEYLASFSLILKDIYMRKTLMSCPKENLSPITIDDDLIPLLLFQEFNKGASKNRNFKVREMFIRQLLQLKGMSVDKALAIVEKYPTPLMLHRTMNDDLSTVGEKLLSTLEYGKLKKKIGPIISKTIYQMFHNKTF